MLVTTLILRHKKFKTKQIFRYLPDFHATLFEITLVIFVFGIPIIIPRPHNVPFREGRGYFTYHTYVRLTQSQEIPVRRYIAIFTVSGLG